ncbi:MAG: polyphosphate polymerase domain-containing protein [Clostridiales bacterium]|nr:polyphosphate polymerase domain-containing protein [Clostridiales bacterium]
MAVQQHSAYRHEQKYVLDLAEAELLAMRLRLSMEKDPHALQSGGTYHIRSLYFDDPYDSAIAEKIAGVEFRNKYRIRIYNLSDRTIKFERKHKNGAYIKKESLNLSRAEAEALIAGRIEFLFGREESFAREMYAALRTRALRPRVLVDYTREPFLFAQEDVRITFDRDIRTAYRCTDLFNPYAPTIPAQAYRGCCILEVKYNRYLPAYIRGLIQVNARQQTAASKYIYSRQFEY